MLCRRLLILLSSLADPSRVIAKEGGAEIDDEIQLLEEELAANPVKHGLLNPKINVTPAHFTWLLVGFASMGGLLSGIDQSLISGANLYMPASLHLDSSQVSGMDMSYTTHC